MQAVVDEQPSGGPSDAAATKPHQQQQHYEQYSLGCFGGLAVMTEVGEHPTGRLTHQPYQAPQQQQQQ